MKFTEAQLGMIGAQSVRWPAATAGQPWKALHHVVEQAKQLVVGIDQKVSAIEADRDLSDVGRVRKIGEEGKAHMGLLLTNDFPALKVAEAEVASFLEKLEAGTLVKVAAARKAGPATTDDGIHAEIRAFLRGHEGAAMFAHRHRSDPRVFAAIAEAPAFLSGMTEEQHREFLGSAASSLYPEQTRQRAEAERALHFARLSVRQAERMIGERASGRAAQGRPGSLRNQRLEAGGVGADKARGRRRRSRSCQSRQL
jgi:hypothetical protein